MASPVGVLLQHWRAERRMSQLALAHEAGVTPRHVSFVESGRANPSREMVLTLTRALDVPLRERNQVLLAAGYAPQYRETGLDDISMTAVNDALNTMLTHLPHPAVVMDRHWNLLRANPAADELFGWLLDGATAERNIVRLMFGPLRPHVANWDETGEALVQRVHREAIGGVPDLVTRRLLDEVLADDGIPAHWRTPDFARTPLPLLPIRFAKAGRELSYFSLVTTVGTPQDITLQELRVESFFPSQ
ncbi:helix-turn-helix transcriptional regulator [Solirubrobacter soli]|uniref:helix-turn-helix transcriptional regulator n=1 Tax=Solirubrobacter soli TaxID=363832 RepID=UPI001B7F88FF|nr:helix-turn-helix transcriptional regulator [Solirubrobacter soli]